MSTFPAGIMFYLIVLSTIRIGLAQHQTLAVGQLECNELLEGSRDCCQTLTEPEDRLAVAALGESCLAMHPCYFLFGK